MIYEDIMLSHHSWPNIFPITGLNFKVKILFDMYSGLHNFAYKLSTVINTVIMIL